MDMNREAGFSSDSENSEQGLFSEEPRISVMDNLEGSHKDLLLPKVKIEKEIKPFNSMN